MTGPRKYKGPYREFYPRTWTDGDFKRLSPPQPNGQTLWIYMLTGEEVEVVHGLLRGGPGTFSERLGWNYEEAARCFAEILGADGRKPLIKYDEKNSLIRLPRCFEYKLPSNQNVMINWRSRWDMAPDCDLKNQWLADMKTVGEKCGPENFGQWFKQVFGQEFKKRLAKPLFKQLPKQSPKPLENSSSSSSSSTEDNTAAAIHTTRGVRHPDEPAAAVNFFPPYIELALGRIGIGELEISALLENYPESQLWRAVEHTTERSHPSGRCSGYFLKIVEDDNLGPSRAEKAREKAARKAEKEAKDTEARAEREKQEEEQSRAEDARFQAMEEAWSKLTMDEQAKLLVEASKELPPGLKDSDRARLAKAQELMSSQQSVVSSQGGIKYERQK